MFDLELEIRRENERLFHPVKCEFDESEIREEIAKQYKSIHADNWNEPLVEICDDITVAVMKGLILECIEANPSDRKILEGKIGEKCMEMVDTYFRAGAVGKLEDR